jgi:hypothetical protein
MDDVIKGFLVSIGFAADDTSRAKAERSVDAYEKAVRDAEKAIEDARWAGAKTQEEVAKLSRELNLKLAKEALANAQAREKQEQEAAKKHRERTARAAAQMRSLVNVAAATAVAVQGFTVAMAGYATHVAAKLEEMAYASDRTKSSVQDLKVFSQAVSQLGGSAGGALSDLENFAARLRSNPQGYTAFLKSVGVEARDAQGNIRGAAELYKEFRRNVGEKSYEQQLLYMQEMGVSEQTWRATDPAKLAAEEARSRAKYARLGYDPDKAKEDAKGLEHALRDMFESINIIGEKTASKIFADVGDNLKGFTTFIEQHGDQIAEILSKVAQLVLAVSRVLLELLTSDKVKGGLDWLMGMFGHVEEGTGKWVADTEKIKAALEALAVFVATVFVAKITGAFADILKELKPLLALLAPVLAALGIPILGTAVVGAVLGGLGDPSKSVNGTGGRPDGQLNPGDELPGVGGGTPAPAGSEGALARAKRLGRSALNALGIGGGGGGRLGKLARNENAQTIIGELRKAGYNDNAIAAVVGSMQTESTFNPRAANDQSGGHTGLWQWDKNRWPKIAKWIKDQGGDPYDARWQTRAWIAEHNAKPGDPIYDTGRTQRGGAILKNNPSLEDAIVGVRESERFGPGEEGGRANHARTWLPTVRAQEPTAAPTSDASPAPSAALKVLPNLAGAAQKFGEGMGRLDMDKFKGIGAATQGFDPSQFLNAPPVGTTTSNDNSVKQQSYKGGDTHVTINTHGDVRDTAELWKRHGERSKADDLRYASSVFA